MVSITNVSSGQAETYYQRDNYYSSVTGDWQGKGAEALGLQGEVRKEDFQRLLLGQDKIGNQLVSVGGEEHKHRAGVDLTFSAPKSVSIVSEVLGDSRVKDAHNEAVSKTLNYVEQHFSQIRQTENKITGRIDTNNLVIAKFNHNLSRELDPHLHTHAVILNMSQRQDGLWRALSNEKLYENKMLIGQIYRNELAKNLKEIGYEIRSDNRGFFEISGVDSRLLDHFSQRSEQIDNKVKELKENNLYSNVDGSKVREFAALDSRVAKSDVDINTVREVWHQRINEQGFSKESIEQSIKAAAEQAKQTEQQKTNQYDIIRQSARIHTEKESTFGKADILITSCKLSVGDYRISDLEKAFNSLKEDKEIKSLSENTFTTKEMQKIERDIVLKVKKGYDTTESILQKEQIQDRIRDFEAKQNITLTEGQKNAVEHILSSKDRYIGVQGDAGTGKTTMLSTVKEQAESQGYTIRGLSFTGKAASEIQTQAGIKSQTIDSFLASKDSLNLSGKQLWVVDEASMLGSQKMHEIMKTAEKVDAKIAFIGDIKQLQPVDAGKMFSKLQETNTLNTVRMSEIQRQKDTNYKDIVKNISERKIDEAFNKLESQNRITEISNRAERLEAIKSDFINRDYKNSIIVTARNADKNDLNQSIRAELQAQNKISSNEYTFTVRESKNLSAEEKHFAQSYEKGDRVIASKAGLIGRAGAEAKVVSVDYQNHNITVQTKDAKLHQIDLKTQGQHLQVYTEKDKSFSQNERIVFLKNDKSLNVKNGQVGEIESISKNGSVAVRMENGDIKNINIKTQYNYIDRGYAVTDYKSQGQTAKDVIYHADTTKGVNYNQAYVAVTRGKEDLQVYTDSKANLQEQMKLEQAKTSTLDYKTNEIEQTISSRDEQTISDKTDRAISSETSKDKTFENETAKHDDKESLKFDDKEISKDDKEFSKSDDREISKSDSKNTEGTAQSKSRDIERSR